MIRLNSPVEFSHNYYYTLYNCSLIISYGLFPEIILRRGLCGGLFQRVSPFEPIINKCSFLNSYKA